MRKQVLINVEATEVRLAMLEDGALVELFVEDIQSKSNVGSLYLGRVEGIVPGLKAVFLNIGRERNAFLHFSGILPEYDLPQRGRPERAYYYDDSDLPSEPDDDAENDYVEMYDSPVAESSQLNDDEEDDSEAVSEEAIERPKRVRIPHRSKPLCVGDEILVQVIKDEINDKGARVTSFVSLPGRYLVMMPYAERTGGVSRRIDSAEERKRLRHILRTIQSDPNDPEFGRSSFIIRTAGLEQDEKAIREDAEQLRKTWRMIQAKAKKSHAPCIVYNEQEILSRVARDYFSDDLDEILVDSKPALRQLINACQLMIPSLTKRIHYFDSTTSLFDAFEVELQFQGALSRKVMTPSGGGIVVDETEALTAIDVNSGRYVGQSDQEQVILHTNLEACHVIARQLRLRDIGGLIVIDFIDMATSDQEASILRELKRCLKSDRARFSVSNFSEFGTVQMTRKRVRRSLARSLYRPCPYCEGEGRIQTESQLWKALKYDLTMTLERIPRPKAIQIQVHETLKQYMQSHAVGDLSEIANAFNVSLNIVSVKDSHHERYQIVTPEMLAATYMPANLPPTGIPPTGIAPPASLNGRAASSSASRIAPTPSVFEQASVVNAAGSQHALHHEESILQRTELPSRRSSRSSDHSKIIASAGGRRPGTVSANKLNARQRSRSDFEDSGDY